MQIIRSADYRSADFYSGEQTPLRTAGRWELEYYDGGEGFSVIGGQKYPHAGPHFLLARPGDERFSIGRFTCRFVHFTADLPVLDEIPTYIPAELNDPAAALLPLSDDPLRALADLCTVLSLLRDRASAPRTLREPYMDRILLTKAYIEENYAAHITLEKLAALAYLSKNFYRTTFSRIMEVSPTVYLRRVRVAHAITLLRETDIPYAEVALRCGFESQSYLNHILRRETARTPREIRKNACFSPELVL